MIVAPHGGWNQVIEPRAIHRDGVTYFATVSGADGHIRVSAFDGQDTQTVDVGVSPPPKVIDIHNGPVIHIRADGRIVVVWAGHNSTQIHRRVSTAPLDISSWGPTLDIGPTVGGTAYTYPNLVKVFGTLHLFIRDGQATPQPSTMRWAKSTDDGDTWSAVGSLFTDPSYTYWVVDGDGERIDIAISDGHPLNDPTSKIYHLYLYGGNRFRADGSQITAPLPLAVADLPVVYDSSDGPGWPGSIVADTVPSFTYGLDDGTQWVYRWARWNGSAWEHEDVGASSALGQSTLAGTTAWAVVDDEIHRFDRIATDDWLEAPVTVGSADRNLYPVRVHGSPGEMLWLAGRYTTAQDYDLSVMAQGSPTAETPEGCCELIITDGGAEPPVPVYGEDADFVYSG